MLVRRAFLFVPLLAITPAPAFANDLEIELDKLITYFKAAATMTGATAVGVASLRPAKFRRAERPKVAAQINDFHTQLTELSIAQGVMLGDMGDYIESVRARGFSEAEHPQMWRGIVSQMQEISGKVRIVFEAQQDAPWLNVALSTEDRDALSYVLLARGALLSQLRALPAPRTPIEIDKLAALHARYLDLAKQLFELRNALSAAKQRFA